MRKENAEQQSKAENDSQQQENYRHAHFRHAGSLAVRHWLQSIIWRTLWPLMRDSKTYTLFHEFAFSGTVSRVPTTKAAAIPHPAPARERNRSGRGAVGSAAVRSERAQNAKAHWGDAG